MHYRKRKNNVTNKIVMRYTITRINFRTFSQSDQNFRTTLKFQEFQEFHDNWDSRHRYVVTMKLFVKLCRPRPILISLTPNGTRCHCPFDSGLGIRNVAMLAPSVYYVRQVVFKSKRRTATEQSRGTVRRNGSVTAERLIITV